MEITRKSMFSGETRTLDLDCTMDQILRWRSGEFIQDALPNLTPAEREFVKSGITPEEWDREMKDFELK